MQWRLEGSFRKSYGLEEEPGLLVGPWNPSFVFHPCHLSLPWDSQRSSVPLPLFLLFHSLVLVAILSLTLLPL